MASFADLIRSITEFAPDVEELGGGPSEVELPFGFVNIFGDRPQVRDFLGGYNPSRMHSIAVRLWDQDLKYFKQVGLPLAEGPEYASLTQFNLARALTENWDLGAPILYEGRYGWKAQFPDSLLPDFEVPADILLFQTHFAVSHYQIKLYQDSDPMNDPVTKHPFVPGWVALASKGKAKGETNKKRRRRKRNRQGKLVW